MYYLRVMWAPWILSNRWTLALMVCALTGCTKNTDWLEQSQGQYGEPLLPFFEDKNQTLHFNRAQLPELNSACERQGQEILLSRQLVFRSRDASFHDFILQQRPSDLTSFGQMPTLEEDSASFFYFDNVVEVYLEAEFLDDVRRTKSAETMTLGAQVIATDDEVITTIELIYYVGSNTTLTDVLVKYPQALGELTEVQRTNASLGDDIACIPGYDQPVMDFVRDTRVSDCKDGKLLAMTLTTQNEPCGQHQRLYASMQLFNNNPQSLKVHADACFSAAGTLSCKTLCPQPGCDISASNDSYFQPYTLLIETPRADYVSVLHHVEVSVCAAQEDLANVLIVYGSQHTDAELICAQDPTFVKGLL